MQSELLLAMAQIGLCLKGLLYRRNWPMALFSSPASWASC